MFGLMNGVSSVHKSIDRFIENNNYPDIKIITNLEDESILEKFNKEEYKILDTRLSINTILKRNNDIISVKASTYEDKNIDDFYVWKEEKNTSENYEVLVEKKFAENNEINLGDIFYLKVGEEYYTVFVSKIIAIPEAIVSAPVKGFWGGVSDYGNVYINKKILLNETNKAKNKLLDEIIKKEEELNTEEKNKMEEFDVNRAKIEQALNQYNTQRAEYLNSKDELQKKKNELNNNKQKLLDLKSEYLEKVEELNNKNEKSKSRSEKIFKNQYIVDISKEIKDSFYSYMKEKIDENISANLKDYTNDTDGDPLETINELIKEINNGINDIDNSIKNIETELNLAYKTIKNNQNELDRAYNTFVIEIADLRTEIENKKTEIENIKGYESKLNEINIKVEKNIDTELLLEKIKNNELKDIEILDSYTYDYSPIKNSINMNIVGMERVATIIPIIFYIIILIVLFVFISLIIKQSKTEIAIFRLLGKSKNKIRLGYCINNLIVSIFGVALGFFIGNFLMIFIVNYYKEYMLLPDVIYEISSASIFLSIIITIVVVEIATILATLELDKITPIEVLRKESYQNKEISKFTKIITSKFKPLKKFSLIVYIRNKRNLILEIICTSATVALIFSSLAYVASKDRIFNQYFDERINYDAQLFKKDTITEEYLEEIRKIDYVENADLLRYFNVRLKGNNQEIDVVINALDNNNEYIKIFDKNNNEIKYPENGIVLEEHIAKQLGLQQNDYVDINGIQFQIVDISFQSMGRVNYISLEDSKKLNSSFETIVLKMDNSKQNDFINRVSNDEDYIYTVDYNSLREYNKKEFDSYVIPAIIIIIFTMIIGFAIIININNYNLIDQKKNLSIFRSLGFSYNEISNNWFIQSIIQWIISVLIGVPSGIVLSKYILKMVSSSRREYIYSSGIKEVLITIVLLFTYILISHIISMKKIKKFDIIEEIKDRD